MRKKIHPSWVDITTKDFLRPRSKWHDLDKLNAMFSAFIDDSGTAPDQKVANATALIIPTRRIPALESEWKSFAEKYCISSFHTSECVSKNDKSEFAHWDDSRVKAALARVRQIAKKYGVQAFSFAISKRDYDAIIPSELREKCGQYHYTWAIRNLATYVDEWSRKFGASHHIDYFFDWMDPRCDAKREIDEAMREADKVHPDRFLDRYSFRRRREVIGLQCVDLLAWTCYRYALHKIERAPLTELQRESWNDFDNYRKQDDWLLALGQKPEQMREFVRLRLKVEDGIDVKLLRMCGEGGRTDRIPHLRRKWDPAANFTAGD